MAAKKKKQTPSSAPPLSPGRRRLFAAITISLPFLILLVAEVVLRLFGWGGYPPFLREIGPLASGGQLCLVEPAAAKPYFFANPTRPGYAEQSNFVMPKPADTVRIFLLGESAAKGYPQPRNLSMGSFLRAMLSDAWPGKTVEIIDLGTTAVASFPLVYMVRDALRFDPDLFIFYTGNNEFFGAYGTASINAAGTLPPWALRLMRTARGLALVQVLDGWLYGKTDENRTLMEQMIGRTFIPADASLRAAAGRNLGENLGLMLDDVQAAGVPAIVCTTASNETGLAPLGEDDVSGLDAAQQQELRRLLGEAELALPTDPARAAALLREAVALGPRHARARFLLGRALAATGDASSARAAFLEARDLDTMPWRPVSQTEEAIRSAARSRGVPLCDVAETFRAESPEGATGWTLLDDHVHLSLAGQARAARAMVQTMTGLPAPLTVGGEELAALPDDATYAQRLGANIYDDYRVNHTLRVLFGVPFMKKSNETAFARFEEAVRSAEDKMSPAILEVARQWQTFSPHAGGLRPLAGMVARVLLREGKAAEALPLYELAARQVPDYTSWYLEYVYFALACRQKLHGALSAEDLAEAAAAIAQGEFLLANGFSESGLTERYLGRLHQLRGEWAEAIPFLLAARPKMSAEDLVALDQALILSYMNTSQKQAALALADDGIRNSGRFAGLYRQMRAEIEKSAR
jgi:tetratricopeptide (TPR) repeat protein